MVKNFDVVARSTSVCTPATHFSSPLIYAYVPSILHECMSCMSCMYVCEASGKLFNGRIIDQIINSFHFSLCTHMYKNFIYVMCVYLCFFFFTVYSQFHQDLLCCKSTRCSKLPSHRLQLRERRKAQDQEASNPRQPVLHQVLTSESQTKEQEF